MEKNKGGILFIGGIHGVGKTTICNSLCSTILAEYLSASDLLQWNKSNNSGRKQIDEILPLQEKLISALKTKTKTDKLYVFDGHYCLLDSKNKITPIPIEVFKEIAPVELYILLDDIETIAKRLITRDKRAYNKDLLSLMQDEELSHAKNISKEITVPLTIITPKNYKEILDSVRIKFSLT